MPAAATASEARLFGDRFVELPENRLAAKAVQRLARAVVRKLPFPVVVIHGPPGCGKSLLAAALVRRVIRGPAVRTVQSLPANELAFSADAPVEYQDLAAVDLLVIEDLQQLSAATGALLTRLLDDRSRRRRATLVTLNAGPAQIKKLPRRLLNRLDGGLVVAIEPYSSASRKRVLQLHLKTRKIALDPDALDWLAARGGGSLRRGLGALDVLERPRRKDVVSLAELKLLLAEPEAAPGVDRIVEQVAKRYGIKKKELLGPSRLRTVLLPRQVAMFLARDLAMMPLPRIGEHFARDHSTVQHAVEKIRAALAGDRQLAGTIRQLKSELS